jgi:tetratricopeptide (TPR) repeat protein
MTGLSKKLWILLFSGLALQCASQGHESTKHILDGNENALRGDYSIAIASYEKALELNPQSIPAKRNLGIVLVKVGNYKAAKDHLESVKESYTRDTEFLYFWGEATRGSSDLTGAVRIFNQGLEVQPRDLRMVKALAWTYHKLGQHQKSIDMTQTWLKEYPTDSQLRLILASAFLKLKRYQEGADSLRMFQSLKSNAAESPSTSSERALILTVLAQNYLGKNDCDQAGPLFLEVLRTRPFLADALTGSARCDIAKKNFSKAIVKLDRATKTDPEHPDAHYLLGRLYEKTEPSRAALLLKRFLLLSKNQSEKTPEKNLAKKIILEIEKTSNKK